MHHSYFGWNPIVALNKYDDRIVASRSSVEFYIRPSTPNMVRAWGRGPRKGGRDSTVEAGTSLKCQRHHNSREAKERLLAGLEPAKKSQLAIEEQIKIACTFYPLLSLHPAPLPPRARVFSLEGKTRDWKGERAARCLSSEGGLKSPRQDKRTIYPPFALWSSRVVVLGKRGENKRKQIHVEKLCEVNDVSGTVSWSSDVAFSAKM